MAELAGIVQFTGATEGLSFVATSDDAQASDAVWYAWQSDFQGHPSGTWLRRGLGHPPGGVDFQRPAVALNADGRLEVVAVGSDQAIWHRWQTAPQGGAADDATGGQWSQWQLLGRPSGQEILAVVGLARNKDGRLELFTVAGDGSVWHRWQRKPGGSWAAAWSSLGTPGGLHAPGVAAVAQNKDGRLELFTVAGDGSVWHRWQPAPGRRTWAAWSSLERPSGQACAALALAVDRDGRLALFTVASDGAVWHRRQRAAEGWSAWESLERQVDGFDEVAVGANADGRLLLAAIAPSPKEETVWLRQEAVEGGWSDWVTLLDSFGSDPPEGIGPTESPTLHRNFDGKLVLHLLALPPAHLLGFPQNEPNGTFSVGGIGLGPLSPVGDVPVLIFGP
jgi:hypothetical protein